MPFRALRTRTQKIASTAELMARMGHGGPVAALRYHHAADEQDRAVGKALSKLVSFL